MRILLLMSLLVSLASSGSSAGDDCVAGEAEAAFTAKTEGLQGYKMEKLKGENVLLETFKLKDGTAVAITQGGCAHFGRSVKFTIPSDRLPKRKTQLKNRPKVQSKEDTKFWLAQALDLLGKLPSADNLISGLKSDLMGQEKQLLQQSLNLVDGKRIAESTDSDGYTTVRLEILENGANIEIVVAADTAL